MPGERSRIVPQGSTGKFERRGHLVANDFSYHQLIESRHRTRTLAARPSHGLVFVVLSAQVIVPRNRADKGEPLPER